MKWNECLLSFTEERGKIVKTVVYHDAMEQITVDGFQSPNFYKKVIQYSGDIESLTNIIERSASCYQNLEYRCNNSRLLGEAGEKLYYSVWLNFRSMRYMLMQEQLHTCQLFNPFMGNFMHKRSLENKMKMRNVS